ncbi:hypothetical protein QBC33DRAFT_232992 [Phialemonium atrogriseum]|uniref:AB hydrolase-1 domain-containing protein n=1 Tax=Phialemonium atrogriseum TaxID=1093897 RepID=A0AAJ0C7V1_9PEZI|nr:uncharacterized protein QBC33DRAFT_232992 [Phialemonium atrogriseum]KAK1771122.1 hypothetical protein QBC33DRAFT_232992 [Phialemonium atrogriseum]
MSAPNPIEALPPPPSVSKETIHMSGILVDVYGLAELGPGPGPDGPPPARVSCLWLHHPRGQSKEDMADIAARCVAAWNGNGNRDRGLIAAAFDQRNHGGRLVRGPANAAWRAGNPTHAQDMFGVVAGTVADQVGLVDAVGGYLFRDRGRGEGGKAVIDQHLALGVSLGGHSVWQLMFADPRVRAGVVVIGCPDYMGLMSDRARLSKLPTYLAADDGASFIGSKDFPTALVEACKKSDPKAICFGTDPVPSPSTPLPEAERQRLGLILGQRVLGKRFLLCSGGDDKLVPYKCAQPFVDWFRDATATWLSHGSVHVDDKVYPAVGHVFSADMVKDAVQFVLDAVSDADGPNSAHDTNSEGDQAMSKI